MILTESLVHSNLSDKRYEEENSVMTWTRLSAYPRRSVSLVRVTTYDN